MMASDEECEVSMFNECIARTVSYGGNQPPLGNSCNGTPGGTPGRHVVLDLVFFSL